VLSHDLDEGRPILILVENVSVASFSTNVIASQQFQYGFDEFLEVTEIVGHVSEYVEWFRALKRTFECVPPV